MSERPAVVATGERPTILVVDDVPMFRELESLYLAGCGRVLTAASGEEALEIVALEQPDAVVLDFDLGGLSGEQVCRTLKADPVHAHVHVVAVTAGDAEAHASAVHAGADDVIAKPLSRVELVEAVSRFVRFSAPRGLPRVVLAEPVKLVREGEQESWGTLRNLSRGGLFVESDCAPERGSELTAEFRLPETGSRVRRTVTVVWRRARHGGAPGGLGLRFVGLDGGAARRLEDWVYERAEPAAPEAPEAPRSDTPRTPAKPRPGEIRP